MFARASNQQEGSCRYQEGNQRVYHSSRTIFKENIIRKFTVS
ncbi:unnamed protein product [Nezara viridula]|uniref:Uncharacterized protein n=1 Tax=Nezara viridula TaxID=85310 RepID=A0A9P0H6P9_NEZVI|nr:unnamed protein product [Nezara viridula]